MRVPLKFNKHMVLDKITVGYASKEQQSVPTPSPNPSFSKTKKKKQKMKKKDIYKHRTVNNAVLLT